jgi:hypothetical protein
MSGGLSGGGFAWDTEPLFTSGTAGGYQDTGAWNTPGDQSSFWGNNTKLNTALQGIGKGLGGLGSQGSGAEAQIATNSGAGGGVHPGSATLEALVQLLMQRRLALLQQATAVGVSPTTKGLLGV